MNSILYIETAIGRIGLEEDGTAVTHLYFPGQPQPAGTVERETPLLLEAARQLEEYFAGNRKSFELPLAPAGTPFQRRVWEALCAIPYGGTRSYKQIAEMVGNPNACRAVGMANNKNPIAILIPCHRVVGADGKLVGYGGGLETKRYLLELERG